MYQMIGDNTETDSAAFPECKTDCGLLEIEEDTTCPRKGRQEESKRFSGLSELHRVLSSSLDLHTPAPA